MLPTESQARESSSETRQYFENAEPHTAVLSGNGNAEPALCGHLIDKALRHLRLLGIELVRDREDDIPGEGPGLYLKFNACASAPGCLQFRGLRVQALLKRHVSSR